MSWPPPKGRPNDQPFNRRTAPRTEWYPDKPWSTSGTVIYMWPLSDGMWWAQTRWFPS